MDPIDRGALLEAARRKTGLVDYGDEDFLEPLERIVDALNREARLNESGRYRARASLLGALRGRLEVEDCIRRHPALLARPVDRPVFIVGLPRTGTTALHHLLNQDAGNHTLRLWEGTHPVPPPEDASYCTDPRIALAAEAVRRTEEHLPGFRRAHLLGAEEPDECFLLFNRNFMSVQFNTLYRVPSFAAWLFAQDLTDCYAYHKRQLQLLQFRKSGRWVLKSPFHQLGLGAILTHYPDALIVQTHRAPLTIVASGCAFCEVLKRPSTDALDLAELGQEWLDMLDVYTRGFEAARARLEPGHPGQFVDVYYDDFVADPMAAVERIYGAAGQPLTTQASASMQAWLERNPQGRHGRHEPRLSIRPMSIASSVPAARSTISVSAPS